MDRIEMLSDKIMGVSNGTRSDQPIPRVIKETHNSRARVSTVSSDKSPNHDVISHTLPLGKEQEVDVNDRGQTDRRFKITRKNKQGKHPILTERLLGGSGKHLMRSSGARRIDNMGATSAISKQGMQILTWNEKDRNQQPAEIEKRDLGLEHPDGTELLGEGTTLCQGLVPNLSGVFRSNKDLSYAHMLEEFDATKARIMLIGLYQRVVSEERIHKLGWWYVFMVVLIWHLHALRYCLHLP